MSQIKVFEFAKQVGLETLVLMDKIKEWKLPIKNHMATLDEEMLAAIRERLNEETQAKAAKTKTKTKSKTAGAKAAGAAPAKTATKTTTKTAAKTATPTITKPVAAKTVRKAAPVVAAPEAEEVAAPVAEKATVEAPVKKSTKKAADAAEEAPEKSAKVGAKPAGGGIVIRRKADIAAKEEAAAQAAAEAAAREAEEEAAFAAAEAETKEEVAPVPSGPLPLSGPIAAAAAAQATGVTRRTNIVGRMDLSKARAPQPAADSRTRPGGPVRNIRAGFVAAPTPYEVPPPVDYEEQRRREKEKEIKKRPGSGREEIPQTFNAADFRKREVIFQPKKKKLAVNKDFKKTAITTPRASKRVIEVDGTMKVAELANALGVKASVIVKKLMVGGVIATMNMDLDFDTISLMTSEYDYEAVNVKKNADELMDTAGFGELDAELVHRPPVVTVMGHVDHGKTSLLDAIRKAKVAEGEAGGITQHIGAYKVILDNGKAVTFIDTPGHEAFTSMRARGANITDVAIIVVAADDGVMPQTAEAINHAKAAEVPIIIAVNKIDKPGAMVEKIKQQLTEYQIVPEEWGGTNIFCEVSALKRTGIEELLERILLVAEVEDLKANPKRAGRGTVIEARLEKGRGAVATMLVQDGTLRVGDHIVAGTASGRVRAMMNDKGEQVKEAYPGDPVEVLGLPETPHASDRFEVTKDEVLARKIAETRRQENEAKKNQGSKGLTLEDLYGKVKKGETYELPIVLKADVSGSIEAVKGMLEKASTDDVKIKIVHAAVGGVNESDVLLAGTAKGIVIGFNVRPDALASQRAKEKGIELKCYTIVYNMIDDVKKAMVGLLQPDRVEKQTGRAEVRNLFSVPKLGNIAGCSVLEGKITRSDQVRLVRDGVIAYTGKIASLRRFKDDTREVAQGFECGIGIENFNDIKIGDIIETFIIEEIAREL